MKIHRTYSIDVDLIDRMKNVNASELINRLLIEHFDKEDMVHASAEELAKKIKICDLDLEYIRRKKAIENGEE
jgi:hypothetical protein